MNLAFLLLRAISACRLVSNVPDMQHSRRANPSYWLGLPKLLFNARLICCYPMYSCQVRVQYMGNETWVIKQIPNAKRLRKSRYSKTLIWMDQERKIIPKWVTYNRQGKPFKLFNKDRWNQKDGVWMADLTSVKNLITRRKTTIITLQENLNVPIENENYFSQRVLTAGVFQARLFKKMH